MESLINQINQELARLEVDTEVNHFSGLMVEETDDLQVKVYDDYKSEVYSPLQLLEILNSLESASLESDHPENIWALISPATF